MMQTSRRIGLTSVRELVLDRRDDADRLVDLPVLVQPRRAVLSQDLEDALVRRPDGADGAARIRGELLGRSEEHTSELQSLMRNSYAVFCLKKKNKTTSEHK